MKTRIENGVTIISTGTFGNEIVNKTGYIGVTKYKNNYKSEITIKKHKYLVGYFETLEEAATARLIAEEKRKEGILVEWLNSKPHGNSPQYAAFWDEAIKQYEMERGQ